MISDTGDAGVAGRVVEPTVVPGAAVSATRGPLHGAHMNRSAKTATAAIAAKPHRLGHSHGDPYHHALFSPQYIAQRASRPERWFMSNELYEELSSGRAAA
jgi:hypothetical protein